MPARMLGDAAGDLAGDEGAAAAGRFVVEEDAVAGEEAVGFAVLDGHLVGEDLGHGVGAARVERGGFALRHFLDLAVHLGDAGLVEAWRPSRRGGSLRGGAGRPWRPSRR